MRTLYSKRARRARVKPWSTRTMENATAEVVIVGGGPAGLTAAIALASAGIETVIVARQVRDNDNRTTALLQGSVTALETLGVWPRCREHAAPLRVMRILDATRRLLRAPEVCFEASEIGLAAFGSNVENRFLLAAIEDHARELPALRLVEDEAQSVAIEAGKVTIGCRSGTSIAARLAIGAEGRNSLCR